ncbi:MAG TPA: efflux RND transporter periplasmic adaptor subunit [Pseudomonas sp.]
MSMRIGPAAALCGLALVLGAGGGYWFAQQRPAPIPVPAAQDERPVLYWYDPMYPQQRFDKPGKSPFMDMPLVPRYADAAADSAAVSIDPRLTQNLGLRLATVTRGAIASSLEVTGVLAFNERDVAVVQARTAGFVERVYARAPDDVLAAGAPLADLLVPEWAAAQEEFLALRRSGDAELLAAARQRLRLTGMPATLIARVERSGKAQPTLTITSPIGGVLQELAVRTGMSMAAGDTLARINALDSVWLELAVPEAEAGALLADQTVEARLPALAGEVLTGRVATILPAANTDSRTLRVRVELPNPDGRLRPGLTAQVRLSRASEQGVLWVPSEAVIRTGRRALVMLAEDAGRFRPVEVRPGAESYGRTVVLSGLEEGQQVVASGQFLLDSEASLRGLVVGTVARPEPATNTPVLHEAEGRVVEIGDGSVTLAHGPFRTLGMPGMTMSFPLGNPALLHGLEVGDRVRFAVRESDAGLVVERLEKQGDQP